MLRTPRCITGTDISGSARRAIPSACKRIDRWLALEANRRTPYDEERGRDAFEFEPILSPYLQVFGSGFRIKTPYSRTVVDELRQVPFARWNGDYKVWEIPFASYDDLQDRWETIEEAAKRSEPEERRKRADARRGTEEEAKAKRRSTERRKRRLPVSSDDLPPLGRPVATATYGVVVITDVSGEIVDLVCLASHKWIVHGRECICQALDGQCSASE